MQLEYKPPQSKTKKREFKSFYDLTDEEKKNITSGKHYKRTRKSYKPSTVKPVVKVTKLPKKTQLEKEKWVKLAKKDKIWYVYVLLLNGDNYYVGITGNVARRYEQHSRGNGSKWTAKHKPVSIIEQRCLGRMTMNEAALVEDEVFREYFSSYGYRVRGGGKCQVNPTKW